MTKTELRGRLSQAINNARELKNVGLNPKYLWNRTDLMTVARDLRVAADAIEKYVNERAVLS
jgi:hypothetical protein